MANSILLKEAIADAKAVRETAIANAKIALEEAFTPRLQSILSQKLTAEMEGEEEDADVNEEYGVEDTSDADSSKIDGDNKQPQDKVNNSSDLAKENPDTDVETAEVGLEPDEAEKAKVSEGEEESEEAEEVSEGEYNEEGEEEITSESEEISEEEDEDELDLESIIRELEGELEEELDDEEEGEVEDIASDVVDGHEEEMHEEESEEDAEEEVEETYSEGEESDDEEIDLDEILREMGYGDDESEEEEVEEAVEESNELEEARAELEEAMSTIKSLKGTINEVNLLNAKLLYTNKLFRSYELTNEQKMKVVETLDRTGNVREVKLVFSTLAESFKFTGTTKKQKQTAKLTESFASKPVASTAPSKEVITESTNTMADRFKQLANIK